jgi:hypothetical protein
MNAVRQFSGTLVQLAAVAALAFSVAALTGCSDDEGGGEGASCSTSQDCKAEFLCRNGTCVTKQGNNGGGADAGDTSDQDGTSGNNDTLTPEDYAISYLLDDDGTRKLMVYKTSDGTYTEVSPAGHGCAQNCWLSEDMSTFVWTETVEDEAGRYNVFTAPVSDLEVQGDGELFVSNVASAKIAKNAVAYSKEQSGQHMAYFQALEGGEEISLGSLGSSTTSTGNWFISTEADQGIRFTYTPQTLDLNFGPLDGPINAHSFTVDAQNYQQTSGGYFGQSMPIAISDDGKVAAFVTVAPNNYGECEAASECTGPGQRCGRFGRCTAIEVTAQFVALDNADELGGPCGGPGTCGEIHTCDQPGEGTTDAVCIPKRVVLGLPELPNQNGQTGCELTEGNADYHYTTLDGPITFDSSGNLYGAAARDCSGSNDVGDSDILKIDPRSGDYEVVWGNPDTGYDPDACWNLEEQIPSDEECSPYITAARLSPGHNEIAFLATTPYVAEPRLATKGMDLWTVMRDGEDHQWVGNLESTQTTIKEMHVHPLD